MKKQVGIILICLISAFAWGSENLLKNPGFEEEPGTEWEKRTPEDAASKLLRTSDVAHSGKWSYALENLQSTHAQLRQGNDRSLVLAPGTLVELSAWVKTEMDAKGNAAVKLFCLGAKGETLAEPGAAPVGGKTDWQRVKIMVSIPDNTVYCMVYLRTAYGTGKAFFDDVELRVIRPAPAAVPIPKIGVFTDLAESDPGFQNLKLLLQDGFIRLHEKSIEAELKTCAGATVLVKEGSIPTTVLKAVKDFANAGHAVFMDIRNFAQMRGSQTVTAAVATGSNKASWEFDGPDGTYDLCVKYMDTGGREGVIAILKDQNPLGAWELNATPDKQPDQILTHTIKAASLKKGETLNLLLWPNGGEPCRVDWIKLEGTGGNSRIIEAETMRLGTNIHKVNLPGFKGIWVNEGETIFEQMQSGLLLQKESPTSSGFDVGQIMPRMNIYGMLNVLPKTAKAEKDLEVLAVTPGQEPGLVRQTLGKGSVVAVDMLSIREPYYANVDAYYKYLYLVNTLTNPVRFGEYYPRRLSYNEFVDLMKKMAEQFPGITFQEEGPGEGGYQLCSLNLGRKDAPLYFFYGAFHGSEWEPGYGLLTLAKRLAQGKLADVVDLDKVAVKIVPFGNPWGYDNRKRLNKNGVNLNRQGDHNWEVYRNPISTNWGPGDQNWKGTSPFGEAETATYKRICDDAQNLFCIFDCHGNSDFQSNWLCLLPSTAKEGNEERALNWHEGVTRRMRGRYILQQQREKACSLYLPKNPGIDWRAMPQLINTPARDKYGMLVEFTAGYGDTYGTVLQTDVVCESARALFQAYPVSAK